MHAGPATSGSWDADSWEAAIAPSVEDSLYATGDAYQPVNDWSGVYSVQPEAMAPAPSYGEYYDYESHTPQQQAYFYSLIYTFFSSELS